MNLTQQQLVRVTLAAMHVKATLRSQTLSAVERAWDALPAWRDPDIARFVERVVPIIAAAQQSMSAHTVVYLRQALIAAGADPGGASLNPADFVGAAVRRGADPADVYRRAGVTVWTALAGGVALDDAVARGRERAIDLAATDLQLAYTNTAQSVLDDTEHVVGYERVPSGANTCALCAIASTQRYHTADLMPIHPGCNCDVSPIVASADPGRVINGDLLDSVRSDIRDRLGSGVDVNDPSLLRQQIAVQDHGEYGPTLTVAGQGFTGPGAIPDQQAA